MSVQTVERTMPTGAGLVAVLGAATVLGPLSIDFYLPALPDIEADLGTTTSKVQLTLTACLIGLALGQLVIGPMSDAIGRRRPLVAGMALFVVASLGCAVAPTIEWLIAMRFLQGLCGAAGVVCARSIVRDLYTGHEAVRFFASLMLVTGLAPVLGPLLGAVVLQATSWHGVFAVIALAGAALTVVTAVKIAETLPPERRHRGGLRATMASFAVLGRDRRYVGYIVSAGLVFATAFVYIASAPFVLKDLFGISGLTFSIVFGLNAMALAGFGQVSRVLVRRVGSRRLFTVGLAMSASGGAIVFTAVALDLALAVLLVGFFFVVGSIGLVSPNATALAMADHGDRAGSASALQGVAQFVLGAVVAPLAGIAGRDTAVPMAVLMVTIPLLAALTARLFTGPLLRIYPPATTPSG